MIQLQDNYIGITATNSVRPVSFSLAPRNGYKLYVTCHSRHVDMYQSDASGGNLLQIYSEFVEYIACI